MPCRVERPLAVSPPRVYIRGSPVLWCPQKHLNNPVDVYAKKVYTMMPKTQMLTRKNKRKKKLTHLEQLDEHAFIVKWVRQDSPITVGKKFSFQWIALWCQLTEVWSSKTGMWMRLTLSLPSSTFSTEMYKEVARIGSIVILYMSKLWKARFFMLCDVIFLVRLQEKFEMDHSWEWKG